MAITVEGERATVFYSDVEAGSGAFVKHSFRLGGWGAHGREEGSEGDNNVFGEHVGTRGSIGVPLH